MWATDTEEFVEGSAGIRGGTIWYAADDNGQLQCVTCHSLRERFADTVTPGSIFSVSGYVRSNESDAISLIYQDPSSLRKI